LRRILSLLLLFLNGCVGIPENVTPVSNFNIEKYVGKWFEIARLDHSFERGLTRVTADYSLREDGGVRVLNRGYSEKEAKWKEVKGKAYFVNKPDQGYLKVSFFGPFYGYNTPQILDRGIRCMLAFQKLKEGGYGKEHATQSLFGFQGESCFGSVERGKEPCPVVQRI
jgi:apolipoprotein D and lipocalin family protein